MKMNRTAVNLKELLGCTGAVYTAANYVLVDDGATRAVYTAEEASTLAKEWRKNLGAAKDDYAKGQAYSLACAGTCALRSAQVPEEVAAALAEEAGIGPEELTCGW